MSKRILSVGLWLPSDAFEDCSFSAKKSLLDWDIIIFRPDISEFCNITYGDSEYQGKLCLNETKSFKLKEACAHWRREIKEAVDCGKTVIVYLSKPKEVYVATGKVEYSGTGKNRQATNYVDLMTSFSSLPISNKWKVSQGEKMNVKPEARELLSSYWGAFEAISNYQVIFEDAPKQTCIATRSGNKAVGLLLKEPSSGGSLLCLPDIMVDADAYWTDEGEGSYTSAGTAFGSKFLAEILALDKALRSSERSAEPSWVANTNFELPGEGELLKELLLAEAAVEAAEKVKDQVTGRLATARQPKALLYETGKALEIAVIGALEVLGFSAKNFSDDISEFDVVFESSEGRLIGEVEGRDSKPVAIAKLRQLSANILEDIEKNQDGVLAKGVLFGNGYRLTPPEDRDENFSDKCVSSARSFGIALVACPDLFYAARYIMETGDKDFAQECRLALLQSSGVVVFPEVPVGVERQAANVSTFSSNGSE